MKCLILGGSGQLGRALAATAPQSANIAAPPRADCDITDPAQLQSWFDAVRPALVINAAGYTDVNGAQSHEAEARAVNAQGAGALAVLESNDVKMIIGAPQPLPNPSQDQRIPF